MRARKMIRSALPAVGLFLVLSSRAEARLQSGPDPAADTFERASLGSNWTVWIGNGGIVGGSDLGMTAASGMVGVNWNTPVSADQFCETVISEGVAPNMLRQVYVRRRASDGARYGLHWNVTDGGRWEIKYDGVPTAQTRYVALSAGPTGPAPGDTLRLEVRGDPPSFKGFHNGAEIISGVDAETNRITGGLVGMAYRLDVGTGTTYPTPVFESWRGGSLVSPGPLPSVSLTATDSSATESGTGTGTITVTRTGPTGASLTVNYAVGGSATNGSDYATLGTSVTIPAGQASASITVTPLDDGEAEGNEQVWLMLADDPSYTAGSPTTAVVTVTDDDFPAVRIEPTDGIAAEAGPDTGLITVTRSGPTASALTVSYAIGGTATNGSDYTTIASSVILPPGQVSATILINPIDDSADEGLEAVVLTLNAAPSYDVGFPGSANVTLNDNDSVTTPVVTLAATDADASEPGANTGAFTVTRSGSTGSSLIVSYLTGGTAANGSDYGLIPNSVTIPSGQSSATVTITPIDDAAAEGTETVVLTLANRGTYQIGSPNVATVTVSDSTGSLPPGGGGGGDGDEGLCGALGIEALILFLALRLARKLRNIGEAP